MTYQWRRQGTLMFQPYSFHTSQLFLYTKFSLFIVFVSLNYQSHFLRDIPNSSLHHDLNYSYRLHVIGSCPIRLVKPA